MDVPTLPGISDATLGATLAVAWVLLLGVGFYRRRTGSASPESFSLVTASGLVWLSYGLLQVSSAVPGVPGSAAVALAVLSLLAGIAAGVRWWRLRGERSDADADDVTGP